MVKKKARRWTRRRLLALGWNPAKLASVKNYHQIKTIFPTVGVVASVTDGDTFELQNSVGVRLIGMGRAGRQTSQPRLTAAVQRAGRA